jgi:aldehyde dehydrogenase family 7 protein A1
MLLPYYDSSTPSTTLRAGDPLDAKSLIGPLHTAAAVRMYNDTLDGIVSRGGQILSKRYGQMDPPFEGGNDGNWVWPVVVRPKEGDECWQHETFAPVLYVREFETMEEAIQ